MILQRVNPDKPFVLWVDASRYAVGGTLEQLVDEDRKPTAQDVLDKKTVPVAFMSRKLTHGQRNWVPREQETYAIILALQKWESWIGMQPVLVLTDHKSLESWTKEVLDTPSGPLGRRSRWHQIFSKFDLSVGYIKGKKTHPGYTQSVGIPSLTSLLGYLQTWHPGRQGRNVTNFRGRKK